MGNNVPMIPSVMAAFERGDPCMIVAVFDDGKKPVHVPCIEWMDISRQVQEIHNLGYTVPYRIRVKKKPNKLYWR